MNLITLHAQLNEAIANRRAGLEGDQQFYLGEMRLDVNMTDVGEALMSWANQYPNFAHPNWNNRYLVLLWWLTERAFTDYPILGDHIWPNWIGQQYQRSAITQRFQSIERLALPISNAFFNNFPHIAWPLTQAIIPHCFQKRLAKLILDVNIQLEGTVFELVGHALDDDDSQTGLYLRSMMSQRALLFQDMIMASLGLNPVYTEMSDFSSRVVSTLQREFDLIKEKRREEERAADANRINTSIRLKDILNGLENRAYLPQDILEKIVSVVCTEIEDEEGHQVKEFTLKYKDGSKAPPIRANKLLRIYHNNEQINIWSHLLFGLPLPPSLCPQGPGQTTQPFKDLSSEAIVDGGLLAALRSCTLSWPNQNAQITRVALTRRGLWRRQIVLDNQELCLIRAQQGEQVAYYRALGADDAIGMTRVALPKITSCVTLPEESAVFESWRLGTATLSVITPFESVSLELSLSCEACEVAVRRTCQLPRGEQVIREVLPKLHSFRLQHHACTARMEVRGALIQPVALTLAPGAGQLLSVEQMSALAAARGVDTQGVNEISQLLERCAQRWLEPWRANLHKTLSEMISRRVKAVRQIDVQRDQYDDICNTFLWGWFSEGELLPLAQLGAWLAHQYHFNLDIYRQEDELYGPAETYLAVALTWFPASHLEHTDRVSSLEQHLLSFGCDLQGAQIDVIEGQAALDCYQRHLPASILYPAALARALTRMIERHPPRELIAQAPQLLREVIDSTQGQSISNRDAWLLMALWDGDRETLWATSPEELSRVFDLCASANIARVSYLFAGIRRHARLITDHTQGA